MDTRTITISRKILATAGVDVSPADIHREDDERIALVYGSPTHERFKQYQKTLARPQINRPVGRRPAHSLPASVNQRWRQFYARSYLPVVDEAAEFNWLSNLTVGMEGACGCQGHWAAYLKNNPPEFQNYEQWVVDARNAVSTRIGTPTFTLEETRSYRFIKPAKVVVLSLDSRPDRWEAVTASIAKSEVLQGVPVVRWRARPPAEMMIPEGYQWAASTYATGMDHRAIIEKSFVDDDETVLVLEDDAILQDSFDGAYRAACKLLPENWMGLWLSSDGHFIKPQSMGRGLVRCRGQVMCHAYMLSRRGMRRVWQHLIHCYNQIIDGATHDLMGIEPHFYATELNAVRQFGDRFCGDRVDFYDGVRA